MLVMELILKASTGFKNDCSLSPRVFEDLV